MRNLICSIFTCLLWKRKTLNFVHGHFKHHKAKVVYYHRPWDKDTKENIVADMAKANFYQETYFSGW